MLKFEFEVPSKIIFGEGSSKKIWELIAELGAKKVFCVYGQVIKSTGLITEAIDNLQDRGFEVIEFDKVLPNSPDYIVDEGVKIAKEEKIDVIVAYGGGSSIDTAKAINILLANPGPIHQYEGFNKVTNPSKPLIAIPTTAGTSSEVTSVSVINDTRNIRKIVILGKNVGATYALVDPLLTVNLPASLTAATGMDALTHAIESYVSTVASVCTEINSLKALEIISENLPVAVKNGKNLTARNNMMLACVIVGFAFNNAQLGLVHGIAHTLSAHFGLSHGVANACVLPYVMEFNKEVVPWKMKDIALAMGLKVQDLSNKEGATAAIEAVKALSQDIGIPTLKELQVDKKLFDRLAEDTLKEDVLKFNPRKPTKEDILAILEKAY